MPRPREFDPDQALEQAMRVFWARGYEGVSVDGLCAATGLGRSSFYAAFGDKRNLYLQALARYETASLDRLSRALAGPGSVQQRIGRFLDGLVRDIVRGPGRCGCFIGNCAAELAAGDPATARRVRRSLARIEGEFARALGAAQAAGEIGRATDVVALARFITSAIQGLRLVGKTGARRKALNDIARTALAAVR